MSQTEAFARALIDAQLKDQGWNISDGISVRYEYTLADGDRADYLLCGREGRGLAIVEAKRESINAADAAEQGRYRERIEEVQSIQSQQSTATAKAQATFDAMLAKCFDQGTQTCPT